MELAAEGKVAPIAGLATPRIRPTVSRAAARVAPLLPAETAAWARPSATSRVATTTLASRLERTAWAGCSSMPITEPAGTISTWVRSSSAARSLRSAITPRHASNSDWSRVGSPTSRTWTAPSRATSMAPLTAARGSLSPLMASTATVMGAAVSRAPPGAPL